MRGLAMPSTRPFAIAVITLVLFSTSATATSGCWQTPQPQTLQEMASVVENQQRRAAPRPTPVVATLALSGGRLKTAYSAGLLVGWGETGKRPDFSVVTAVGDSALIAPFAFLGAAGDQKIADLFTCEAKSLEEMAKRAALYVDAETIEKIARRHATGARLIVALPGSAARRETVWDLGAIAASGHPKAQRYIQNILLAAVDLTTFIDPTAVPIPAGTLVARSQAFRQVGAGEPFLSQSRTVVPSTYYLIHNGVLFPDEGEAYMTWRQGTTDSPTLLENASVVPAYDFFASAETSRSKVYLASPRPYLRIQPQSDFDMSYIQALFLDTYRQGRMGGEWRSTFLDRARFYGP